MRSELACFCTGFQGGAVVEDDESAEDAAFGVPHDEEDEW